MSDDGSIHIGTKIEEGGLKAALASVESSLKDAAKYFDTIGDAGKASFKAMASQLGSVDAAAAVTGDKIGALAKKKEILNAEIQRLIATGLKPEDLQVRALKNVYDNLTSAQIANSTSHAKVKKTAMETFASMRDAMQGPVAVGRMVVQAIQKIGAEVDRLESEWSMAEEAGALLNSTLKATGATAWTSADAIQDMASEFQSFTKYEGDAVVGMENVLLGFKNIKGDNFKEASLQILNMATVMKMDLTSAAQAVGKALDDPISGIDSLSRQGFKFSAEQKAMLKAMVQSGDIAKAQGIILKELATTYGGAAEAAGMTGSAIKVRLANAIGDVNEEIGRSISNSLKPWREAWLKMAQSIGAAAKAQNDFREAMAREKEGVATQEDRLLIAKEYLETLKEGRKYAPDAAVVDKEIKKQEELIQAMEERETHRKKVQSAADKALEEAAKRAAEEEKAAARQVEISKKRAAIEQEYSKTIAKIALLEKTSMITKEQADNQRQSALESEIDALVDLITTEKVGIGVTTKLLDEKTDAYVANAEAIKQTTKEISTAATYDAKIDDEAKRRADAYGDSIVEAAKIAEAAKKSFVISFDDIEKSIDALGSALGSLSGDDGTLGEFASAASSIVRLVASGGTDVSAWVSLIDSLSNMADAAGIEEFDQLKTELNEFGSGALAAVTPVLKTIMREWLILAGVLEPLLPFIEGIASLLSYLGEVMMVMMKPAIDLIIVAITLLANLFTFLFNKVIVPVVNFVMIALNKMYNGFADFINKMLQMIDDIPFVDMAYRVARRDESAGTISEIGTASAPTASPTASTNELRDANKELKNNKELFTKASRSAEAYNTVLTGVTETVSSFYEGLQDVGSDLASTIVDSLIDGFDNDDFLYALEEYITKAVVQAAVFTDSFTAQVSSIGTDLAQAIASGDTGAIESLKNQLSSLYTTAAAAAQAATSAVSGAFGSYAVGSMGLPSDGLIYAHAGEAVIPSGLMAEAASRGLTIAPTASITRSMGTINLNAILNVDGKAMAGVVFQYQDELAGAAYGY